MPKIKTSSIEMLVFEENEWKFKKVTKTYEFDQYQGRFGSFVPKGEPIISYSSLESHGLSKTQKMTILVKRFAINPQNLKQLSAIFKQDIQAHIPSGIEYKDWYLSIAKAILKKDKLILPSYFLIHKLNEGSTQSLGFHDPIVKKIGEETRITAKEAVLLLKNGEVGAVLEEDLEGKFSQMGI